MNISSMIFISFPLLTICLFSWFLESAEIYSRVVMIQLICSTIWLACAIFHLDLVFIASFEFDYIATLEFINKFQQVQHTNSGLGLVIIAVVVSAANMFVYCFYGKMATESFEQMSSCLYESNWKELSVDLQKYMMLMIQNSQRSLSYHGFGMINLDLMTFCKVSEYRPNYRFLMLTYYWFLQLLKSVFSSYALFKTLTEQT